MPAHHRPSDFASHEIHKTLVLYRRERIETKISRDSLYRLELHARDLADQPDLAGKCYR